MAWLCWLCLALSANTGQAASPSCPAVYSGAFERWTSFYLPWESWHLLEAQALAESGCEENQVSRAGAVGIMQFMPATAKGLGVNPLDPESAIQGAAMYDRMEEDRFAAPAPADRRDLALAAYNAGPGNIARAVELAGKMVWQSVAAVLARVTGKRAGETVAYVAKIEALTGELQ